MIDTPVSETDFSVLKRNGLIFFQPHCDLARFSIVPVISVIRCTVCIERRLVCAEIVHCGGGKRGIVYANADLSPIFLRASIIDCFKQIAPIECRISDTCYTVWNGYARQPATTIECPISDIRYAIRNNNARQPAATIEYIISDARYAIRNNNACQPAAIFERRISDSESILFNFICPGKRCVGFN